MSIEEIKEIIINTLNKVGIMVDSIDEDLDLGEWIQDSLQYISFVVELEQILDIEMPDEIFSIGSLASFNNFSQKIYDVCNGSERCM